MFSFLKKASACAVGIVMLVSLSACGNKKTEEKGDYLSGNKWQTSSGMLLELEENGEFKWFNSKNERDDNYYSGNFTVKSGQEAIDFLADNHGLPEESQRTVMNRYAVEDENYYTIVMNNKERIQGGENTLDEENEIVFYGYYMPDYEQLDLYSLNNLTPYEFTKM